jgi:hypothetical protein
MLYAGTDKPLPRKSWVKESPDINVQSLIEYDEAIRQHFSKYEVQQIGSTSGCGCDFPHLMYQNGGWPLYEYPETDAEYEATKRFNREGLVNLLRSSAEEVIELYGVWAGDFHEAPIIREDISLNRILDSDFYFKEQGFLRVKL